MNQKTDIGEEAQKGSKRGKKIALVVFSILAPLLAAEIFVRLTSPYGDWTPTIEAQRQFSYGGSAFSRHVFRPEARDVPEGPLTYPINELGYRGAALEFDKDPDTLRVLAYGGSAVFDLAADGTNDWPHQIELRLAEQGVDNVQVINAGTPGHASCDSLGRFYSEGHRFSPDYVIFYNAWNDIKYFRTTEPLLRVLHPYRQDPRITYHGPIDWLLCHVSQLYVRLRNRFFSWRYKAGSEGLIPQSDGLTEIQEDALRQYKLNVELFVDCARNVGAVPILVTQARLATRENEQKVKDRIPYYYANFDHRTLCDAFEATDRILEEASADKGVPLVDASSIMSGNEDYLYDHVHTSSNGSARLSGLVAEEIGRQIKKR